MTSFVNRYTSAGVETGGRARQSRNCLGFASTYDAHHTAAPLHVRASGERPKWLISPRSFRVNSLSSYYYSPVAHSTSRLAHPPLLGVTNE